MADVKISALPAAAALTGTEEVPAVQSAATVKTTAQGIVNLITGALISPATINIGNNTDSTLARASAGDMSIEGNVMYRAGGTDVPVADGGTGVSSLTAYAPVFGGTTSTGPVQSGSLGTATHVLTSNGAGALATFQAPVGVAAQIVAAADKATPVAADSFGLVDSADSNNLKELTWANLLLATRTPNVQAVTSAATVTPTFSDDLVTVTAQAAAIQFLNPTGTVIPGLGIVIRLKDDGTARAITYDTQYRAIGVTLPTTTVLSKTLYLGMIYNTADTKWDVTAVAQEA